MHTALVSDPLVLIKCCTSHNTWKLLDQVNAIAFLSFHLGFITGDPSERQFVKQSEVANFLVSIMLIDCG